MKQEPKLTFKSNNDKIQAQEELINLRNHSAWKRITEYYDRKIEWLEKIINGDIGNDDGTSIISTMDELKYYRMRRNMAQQFRNLPDILIEMIDAAEGKEIDFDPYES